MSGVKTTVDPDPARRRVLRACLAAPLLGAAGSVLSGCRARGALVGTRPFADSRIEGSAFPRRLVDAAGQVHLLPRPPRRIVSTYLACEEMLAALVPISRVAGVSVYADDAATSNCAGVYPPRVARLRAEPERVLALEPDLVCVSGFVDIEAMRLLSGVDLPLLRWARYDSFADLLEGVRLLGAAVGEEVQAAALVASVEDQLADVARRLRGARPQRVLYYDTPGYTMGSHTLVDEIIRRAAGRNVAAEIGIRGPGQIGLEAVLALEPDAIVMPRYGDPPSGELPAARPPGKRLPAVAAARVHEVPAAWITSISHHAARGLARVARILHPAAFEGPPPG